MSVSTSQAGSDRRPGEFGTQVGAQLDPRFGSRGRRSRPVSKPKDTRTVLAHLCVYLGQQRLTLTLVFAATLVSSLAAVFAPRPRHRSAGLAALFGDGAGEHTLRTPARRRR